MWYIKRLLKAIRLLLESSNAMGRLPHYEFWSREILVTLTIQTITIILGYPPEADAKILLSKIDMLGFMGHRKIKQGMTWNIPVHWLTFLVLEGAIQIPEREKKCQQFYSAIYLACYIVDLPGKMCPLVQQQYDYCEVVNHFRLLW